MSIIISADVVPTSSNIDLFINADKRLIGDDLADALQNADHRIFNLEVPLCDDARPIDKCGPHLIAPTASVNGYKMLGADLLTLANNHILDQNEQGLLSTISTLEKSGIKYIGAGKDPESAARPVVLTIKGKMIGVYACCEHEFSLVTDRRAGANPFDPFESFDHVSSLKARCDYVIVLYHGGKERYRYPSPGLQKTCRKFIQKGADLVLCQHTHCIGCEEDYSGGKIVYGQGNFIFDHSEHETWQTALLVRVGDELDIDYIPVRKKGNVVRLADEDDKKTILNDFFARSEEIKKEGFTEKHYNEIADKSLYYYLSGLDGKTSFFGRVLNKITKGKYLDRKIKRKFGKPELLRLQNYFYCQAHNELMMTGVKNRLEQMKKREE